MKVRIQHDLEGSAHAISRKRFLIGIVAAGGVTAWLLWDVFFTPAPPNPEQVKVVLESPLVSSARSIEVPLCVVNPGTNRSAYFFIWNEGVIAGRWIDTESYRGKQYGLKVRLRREGVTLFDGAYGVDFDRHLATGRMSIGVTFESERDDAVRQTVEARYTFWIGSNDISLSRTPHLAVFEMAKWSSGPLGILLFSGPPQPVEVIYGQGGLYRVYFKDETNARPIENILQPYQESCGRGCFQITAMHHEGVFSADPEELSSEFEVGLSGLPRNLDTNSVGLAPQIADALTSKLGAGADVRIDESGQGKTPVMPKQRYLLSTCPGISRLPVGELEKIMKDGVFEDMEVWPCVNDSPREYDDRNGLISIVGPSGLETGDELRRLRLRIAALCHE